MIWDTKKVIGVAVLVGALTQIGNGLKVASWLIGVPDAAYAGQAKAAQVDEKFERYLEKQDAVAEALNQYVATQQQQTPNAPQRPTWRWTEWEDETCWGCAAQTREQCWEIDQDGYNGWRPCE